jgi:holo-[acyl-carrier protein] synthase
MIIGIGTDIIEVSRIRSSIEKYGERFLKRIFTETEINYCESFKGTQFLHYAARFAAKESFSKAIGTGITKGFKFKEIGIKNERSGKPIVELSGGLLKKWGNYNIFISLTHTEENAVAYLLIEEAE